MRVYVDSSALLKRVFEEPESAALVAALQRHVDAGDALLSSSLAWVEVSRAVLAAADREAAIPAGELTAVALSGVLEAPLDGQVTALARRLPPPVLRTLDALHVATAVLLDADLVVAYDDRLIAAARHHGLDVLAPR
ncbi:type II toxin-antitoxin system VapC family toxin [Patulibacter sp. S7RM1-6]